METKPGVQWGGGGSPFLLLLLLLFFFLHYPFSPGGSMLPRNLCQRKGAEPFIFHFTKGRAIPAASLA
jgi:hypothetical protein